MAALYMAVPAVTGQMVLGAKAGAASLVGTAIGGVSGEGGKAAGGGYTGALTTRAKQAEQNVLQAATGKSHRQSGLAARAIAAQNAGLDAGIEANFQGLEQGQSSLGAQVVGMKAEGDGADVTAAARSSKNVHQMGINYTKGAPESIKGEITGLRGDVQKGFGDFRKAADDLSKRMGVKEGGAGTNNAPPGDSGTSGTDPVGEGVGSNPPSTQVSKSKEPGPVKKTVGGVLSYTDNITDMMFAAGAHRATHEGLRGRWAETMAGGAAAIASTNAQAQGSAMQMIGGRVGTEADAEAMASVYDTTASWAQDVSGTLAASNVMANTIGTSALAQQREQLAAIGQLGAGTTAAYRYPQSVGASIDARSRAATEHLGQRMSRFSPTRSDGSDLGSRWGNGWSYSVGGVRDWMPFQGEEN